MDSIGILGLAVGVLGLLSAAVLDYFNQPQKYVRMIRVMAWLILIGMIWVVALYYIPQGIIHLVRVLFGSSGVATIADRLVQLSIAAGVLIAFGLIFTFHFGRRILMKYRPEQ